MWTTIRMLVVIGVLKYSATSELARAVPAPPAGYALIEADGLRLEIQSRGKMVLGPAGKREELDVTLILINNTKEIRSVKQLIADGNRLHVAYGLTYICWFPDGTVLELEPSFAAYSDPWSGSFTRAKPLALPAEGYALGVFNFINTLNKKFYDPYDKNKGRFCLTAVVGDLKLQSNTIRYNDCPDPPPEYVPVKHSRFTPEARAKAEAEERMKPDDDELLEMARATHERLGREAEARRNRREWIALQIMRLMLAR